MALTRAWYTDGNCSLDNVSTALLITKSTLFMIKALLKGEKTGTNGTSGAPPAGSRWTCVGSSDSATANMAGTDLWTASFDATKIVRANGAVAHSWIVLQSPAAMGPYYLCLDYNSAGDSIYGVSFAKTAYTGGTITARPTSVDENQSTTITMTDLTTGGVNKVSRVTDADGNFFMQFSRQGTGVFNQSFGMVTLTETRTGDLRPVICYNDTTSAGRGALSTNGLLYSATGGWMMRSPSGGAAADTSTCAIIYPPAAWAAKALPNPADSKADGFPAYYWWVGASAAQAAIRGRVPDVYITNIWKTIGDVEPASGASERQLVGLMLIPNGGVVHSV